MSTSTSLQLIKLNNQELQLDLNNETIFATSNEMAKIFDTTRQNIELHLKNIFKSKELDAESVCKKSLLSAIDGKKYNTKHYNLDAMISVGYRVNSNKATAFRKEATKILKEYITTGEVKKKEQQQLLISSLKTELKSLNETIYLIANSEETYCISEVAKKLALKNIHKLFKYLKDNKWTRRLSDGENKTALYSHSFALKLNYIVDKQVFCQRRQSYYHQARITSKGFAKLMKSKQQIEMIKLK